jgi:hypothetical protein
MNKETMQQLIIKALQKELGDTYSIFIHEVLKTNLVLDGLSILKQGENVSPSIYLNSFYKDLESGVPLTVVINNILSIYKQCSFPGYLDVSKILDFSNVKNNLFVKLINKHLNEKLLENVPHTYFLDDFAITVHCKLNQIKEGLFSFAITNDYLKAWNLTAPALISIAKENTISLMGLDIENLSDSLQSMHVQVPSLPIWVMTNRYMLNGAATVLNDNVLKKFAATYGNFYIIFSSVHEVLLIPSNDNLNIEMLTNLNQEVNASSLSKEDILGTKAYYYEKGKGIIF